ANGVGCDDGNACTQTDTCQAGTCTGSNPVSCTGANQCKTCDSTTGQCTVPKANGVGCDDGNACTQTDTCQAGTCTGANPVSCTGTNQCKTCEPTSGQCTVPKANGVGCDDGNACTQTDTCQAGTCTGSNPVSCTGTNQCKTCEPTSGQCIVPKANGVACDDGNACTTGETCTAGVCGNPTSTVSCPVCEKCDTTSGSCVADTTHNGTSCDTDNTLCTVETCQA